MQFLSLDDYQFAPPDFQFKESIGGKLAAVVAFGGICAAALMAGIRGYLPPMVCYLVAGFFGLVTLIGVSMLRSAMHSSNWLLRIAGDRMWIKFRSYLNEQFLSNEIQIVQLDRAEVAWIRPIKVRATIENNRSSDSKFSLVTSKYLEIGLAQPQAAKLDEHLRREAAHLPVGNRFIRSKSGQKPVSIVGPSAIRVCWRDPSSRISPGLDKAVNSLSQWIEVRPAQNEQIEFTTPVLAALSTDEQNARLRTLAASDRLAALAVTRKLKGCTISEANQFLDAMSDEKGG